MGASLHFTIFLLTIITSISLTSAIDNPASTFPTTSSPSSPPSSPSSTTTTPSPQFPFSSSEPMNSPELYSPLSTVTHILEELGFHDLALASHSLSLSSASRNPWFGPVTVFAPEDSSVRSCPSCSLSLLLQEHTVQGLYPLDYLNRLVFGTKIETLIPGRCLTFTSTTNATKIFIGGAEITRPDVYVSDQVIIHGLRGFLSHLSQYSCAIDKLTSLDLPHASSAAVLNRMMLADAMIRLRTSGYSILALAMRIEFAKLVALQNMTIFAVDDSSIFHGGHAYVHSVRFHIIPNHILKLADLESLPSATVLPTLEFGEMLTITTPGGGGLLSPMRINYIKIKYPNLIYNLKIVVHGLDSPFPRLHQPIDATTGELGSDDRESSAGNVPQNSETTAAPSSSVIKSTPEIDDVHQGL